MEKRQREKNYTQREKKILLELVKRSKVLEDKAIDKASLLRRAQVWRAIASEYNSLAESGPRDPSKLKMLLKNLQGKARKSATFINEHKVVEVKKEARINELLNNIDNDNKNDDKEEQDVVEILEESTSSSSISSKHHFCKKKFLYEYNSESLKKIYLKKKINLINLQTKYTKIRHYWDIQLKKTQLNKLRGVCQEK